MAKLMHYAGIYATTRLFYENNFIKYECLRVIQGDHNMNIRFNQK